MRAITNGTWTRAWSPPNDLYSFDPNVQVEIDEFTDVIGRHFKQPKEGLGNDNTPVSHMWRSMAIPDAPL